MKHTTATIQNFRILIVDDHSGYRHGIGNFLIKAISQFPCVVDEAECGRQGIDKVIQNDYDIAFVDFILPGMNGHETILEMLRYRPSLKVLGLSSYLELENVRLMMDAGAKGFILKTIEAWQFNDLIKTVMEGGKYFSNEILFKLLEAAEKKDEINIRIKSYGLTERELEVLRMLAAGNTSKVIAEKLSLAKRTIDAHRRRILEKTHVSSVAELTRIAIELGLLDH